MDIREKNDEEALKDIQTIVERNHRWLFLDGQEVNAKTVTLEQLQQAQIITLTHTTLGG